MKKIQVIFFTLQRLTGTIIIVALAAALRILPLQSLGAMVAPQTFNSWAVLNLLYGELWPGLFLLAQVSVINNYKWFFISTNSSFIILNLVVFNIYC